MEYPKAIAAARRAESLDPYSAEVHTLLGDLHLYHLWDWDGAERHFERAIELNPHYVTARHWYGSYLSIMVAMTKRLPRCASPSSSSPRPHGSSPLKGVFCSPRAVTARPR